MPSGMRCSAIECYPSHTWKKRWLRRGLMMASRLGLLTVLFPARGIPVLGVSDAAFSQWLEDICRAMGWDSVYPVFFWPGDPNRGRIYCYLLDPNGVRVGFCKFGLDSTNNRLIQREARTMEVLKEMDLKHCRVPDVLRSGDLGEHAYVVIETTPRGARAIDWEEDEGIESLVAEYAGASYRIDRQELESLDWWVELTRVFGSSPGLMQVLTDLADQGGEVCRVHGDLNRTTVLVDGSETWILDWEQSYSNAPVMTDQICMAVDRLWLAGAGDAAGKLRQLQNTFPVLQDEKLRGPGVLALAFLGAAKFTPALTILLEWFPEEA